MTLEISYIIHVKMDPNLAHLKLKLRVSIEQAISSLRTIYYAAKNAIKRKQRYHVSKMSEKDTIL